MDRLRQVLEEISTRLCVLNTSQRIAIGMCALVVVGSFAWLMQWSTTPEMVPLVNHAFSYAELDSAEESLRANGVDYDIRGTRIFVGLGDRHNALRLLYTAGALPEGSLFDMAAVVTDQNPFQAPEARSYAQNYAKGNELAKIIATSPLVQKASVMINPRTKRRLGGVSDVPTASIALTLAGRSELTDAMVDGFAKLVSGAVAGLKPHNVYVTNTATGRSRSVPHPDDIASFDLFGMQKKREAHLQSKIMTKLAHIPGVQVVVSVELDTSRRVTTRMTHATPQTKLETNKTSEQGSSTRAVEPGVQANLGQAVTGRSGGQTNLTEQTTLENFEPKLSQTETIEQIPFATKSVTAAIGIPRSFLVGVFRARHPDKEEPKEDDPDFVSVRDEQVARVKSSVERIVMAKDPKDVEVDVYPDMEWSADGPVWSSAPSAVAFAGGGSDSLEPMRLASAYGPPVGLAMLALVSMFMMLRVVKNVPTPAKESKPEPSEEAVPSGEEPMLTVGPSPVGQAAVSESLLVAQEVDDDTLRYQQIGEEVIKLVEADPEGAAKLIKRWMDDA